MRVLRLGHPLVLETGQQHALEERQRLVEATVCAQALGLEHVDDRLRCQPDPLACRDEGAVSQRAPERPERAAKAGAGARVQHVGPEAGRDRRARMQTGVQGEPGEERARPPGGSGRLSPSTSAAISPTSRSPSIVKAYNAPFDVSLTIAVTER